MTTPAVDLNSVMAAVLALPGRIAALETEVRELRGANERMREALPPMLVTIQEAAGAVKVSVPTIRRWAREGRIPVVKIGATLRVDLSRMRGVDDLEVARRAKVASGVATAARGRP